MRTTDNNRGKEIAELISESEKYSISDLELIANQQIGKIKLDKYPNLLIFPPRDIDYGDDIDKETIFSLHQTKLTTNNIMGFVGVNNTKLTIYSRFTQKDGNDYFLHYMLQRVLSINIARFNQSSHNESIWDFLPYLFPYYLKRALSQGVYRNYQTLLYNDTNVKGIIDVKRHIRKNIPFSGNVAYKTREYRMDNEITELIRHTIEEIRSRRLVAPVLKNDKDVIDAVNQIVSATESYEKNNRAKIISKNKKPVSHPFFTKYRELQKLCLLILRHKKLSFGNNKDEIYGLLFDGAWLWEEYLSKLLGGQFEHPQNKTRKYKDFLFVNENDKDTQEIYPDFISLKKPYVIADAKYKFLNNSGYEKEYYREDYFQILAYMLRYTSKLGFLIFPFSEQEISKKALTVKETDIMLTILGLPIPQKNNTFDEFIKIIQQSEKLFIKSFSELVGQNK
jgi:5-methylcytosine-specific restriction endonuclease McrBC regulatory subunit McrC